MFLQWAQQIGDCGVGKYRFSFNSACSEDLRTVAICAICNEIEQRGLAHTGLAIDRCGAAANPQRVNEPTQKPSLMITTHHQVDVIERTVVQICGSVERPSTRALSTPGDVGDAHRFGRVTWRALDSTRLVGMAQSLPISHPE
jgi:hypothetical protein